MKKLAVISGFDSQFKWGGEVAKRFFAHGYHVEFFCPTVRFNQISEAQLRTYDIPFQINWCTKSELFSTLRLLDFDVVLFSLPAGLTEEGTLVLRETFEKASSRYKENATVKKRPIIVAGYVGINYENRIGSLVARRIVDIVLANSDAEKQFFDETAHRLGLAGPQVVTGGLGLIVRGKPPKGKKGRPPGARRILFAAQPTVPKQKAEKVYLLLKLREIAAANPNWTVAVKPRHRPTEQTYHRDPHHLEELLFQFFVPDDVPPNLVFDYRPIGEQLRETDLLLTISSTAAIEAHAKGINFAILTDFGLKEPNGAEFFGDCGALTTFSELKQGKLPTPSPVWASRNVAYADEHFEEVLAAIQELDDRQVREGAMLPFNVTEHYDAARGETIDFLEEWRTSRRKVRWVREITSGSARARAAETANGKPRRDRLSDRLSLVRRKTEKLVRSPKKFLLDSRFVKSLRGE